MSILKFIEFLCPQFRPETKEEVYNMRHASARNVIERIFGVVKKRFRMMRNGSEYPVHLQPRITYLMAWLHNFILQESPNDLDRFNEFGPAFQPDPRNAIIHPDDEPQLHVYGTPAQETRQAIILRDKIATGLWRSYKRYRALHPGGNAADQI